jgi:hypothetical protein
MKPIPFYKMSGSGNDFIIIDNRKGVVPEDDLQHFITGSCRRKLSVGADGMILIESSSTWISNGDFTTPTEALRKCAATVPVVRPGMPFLLISLPERCLLITGRCYQASVG